MSVTGYVPPLIRFNNWNIQNINDCSVSCLLLTQLKPGIEAAENKGWPVTLCVSPMSQLLYEHLKFENVATEIVRAEGEEETLANIVMVRKNKA